MTVALPLLLLLATAPPAPAAAPPLALDQVDLDEGDDSDGDALPADENPWTAALLAPMPLPWPLDLLLAGWAPWGRSDGVRDAAGVAFLALGMLVIAASPCSALFAGVMLAASVVVAVLAVGACVSSGLRDGVCPSGRTRRRGNRAVLEAGNAWGWAMCLSMALCSPWCGFKVAQRGWLALRQPLPRHAPPRRRPPAAR